QQGFRVEQWEVRSDWDMLNESATGLHLVRPASDTSRIGAGQLVAVQPEGARSLLLGCVRWAVMGDDGRVNVGIMIFPGPAETIALRSTGLAAVNEKYRQAFLLPPVPALGEPATAIVPFGWYRHERVLEVFTDRAWQIRLTELLDRGSEFDRVAYER
ncbi:MAG TPA: hypothetical protein VMB75_10980, partial [Rhodocyclaceae bacterium]|nr:hypothetical protein [Rhodocyclaceae bacterium]